MDKELDRDIKILKSFENYKIPYIMECMGPFTLSSKATRVYIQDIKGATVLFKKDINKRLAVAEKSLG